MAKYIHQEVGREVSAPAGFYTPLKEVRLKHGGKEVLYIIGNVVVEASCCGSSNWSYAQVPGYIVKWQGEKSQSGLPVSDVEPVKEEISRLDIRKIIQETEKIYPIEFW